MKYCITGATGFIGRELVEQLSDENHKVKIVKTEPKNGFIPEINI